MKGNCSVNEVCLYCDTFVSLLTFFFPSRFTIVYKNEYNKGYYCCPYCKEQRNHYFTLRKRTSFEQCWTKEALSLLITLGNITLESYSDDIPIVNTYHFLLFISMRVFSANFVHSSFLYCQKTCTYNAKCS